MTTPPQSPAPAPWLERVAPRVVRVAGLVARVALGLFILWQIFFLFAYNTVDAIKDSAGHLREQRQNNGLTWQAITFVSKLTRATIQFRLRDELETWLDAPNDADKKATPFGRRLETATNLTRPYAKLTGQEQGWGLFAPDVVSWGSFPAVELRWDADLMDDELLKRYQSHLAEVEGWKKLAEFWGWRIVESPPLSPEIIYSENEPRDWNRFVRIGQFRIRRIEAAFETRVERPALQRELEAREQRGEPISFLDRLLLGGLRRATEDQWDRNIDKKVRDNWSAMLRYMKWKVREFLNEHPEVPMPTQVILRCRGWKARGPNEEGPFEWVFHSDVPMMRWMPWKGAEAIEIYRPSQKRYGQW